MNHFRKTTISNSFFHSYFSNSSLFIAPQKRCLSNIVSKKLSTKDSLSRYSLSSNSLSQIRNNLNRSLLHPTMMFQSASFHGSNSFLGKKVQFNLADIGEGITEVELLEWFIKEGQKVNEFDEIAKVQSDKATVDITSRYDGIISKLHYKVGDIARVGAPLVEIEIEGIEEQEVESPHSETQSTSVSQESPTKSCSVKESLSSKILTTPAVRHLARQHKLDLSQIKGTGKGGRVMKEDVLYFMGHLETKPKERVIPSAKSEKSETTSTSTPSSSTTSSQTLIVDRVEPIRGLKRTMVKTMNLSNNIPTLQLMDDVILDNLITLREQLRPIAETQGIKLTFMPFFIKSASLALKDYPILNARINAEESEITFITSHNIGVAMDTPNGLLVPNVKNCQDKSILEIAKEMQRLQKLGKDGALGTDDLTNGTFSLSNIGAIGGTYATPLINPPESAIVALGKMKKIAVFNDEGVVVPQNILNISVSADHRFIDGATVGRFINRWKLYLESPNALLLALK